MSLNYTWEKLFVAILGMARDEGTLQERLVGAHLNFHTLRNDDFPEGELRESFQDIMHALTWRKNEGEGTVKATTSKMTDEEARDLIEKIVSLYNDVALLHGVELHN